MISECLRNRTVLDHEVAILNPTDSERKILSFKDFKGFKKIQDITSKYTLYEALGKGSFGEVRKAEHNRAKVMCAVKIIKKKAI